MNKKQKIKRKKEIEIEINEKRKYLRELNTKLSMVWKVSPIKVLATEITLTGHRIDFPMHMSDHEIVFKIDSLKKKIWKLENEYFIDLFIF